MSIVQIAVRSIGWSAIMLSVYSFSVQAHAADSSSPPLTNLTAQIHPNDRGNISDRAIAQARQNFQVVNHPRLSICPDFPCLILSQDPSHSQNRFNNPTYKLTAYQDRTSDYLFQLDAVTGRGFTQARNRYQSNTEAPLPDGSYTVSARTVAGRTREVGGTMVPIFPKPGFDARMRRTALGIHWDPSFNRDKKEDGTSGCIALTTKGDYHRVRDFVLKYHPRSLEVRIEQN
jgi:hypothetical protein